MNANNFTQKSMEALSFAQQLAFNNNNPSMETIHLLKGITESDKDVLPFLLNKMNIESGQLNALMDAKLKSLPKQSSESAAYPSKDFNQVMLKANSLMKDMGDSYVSIEHLILSLLSVNDSLAKELKNLGMSEAATKAAIE